MESYGFAVKAARGQYRGLASLATLALTIIVLGSRAVAPFAG